MRLRAMVVAGGIAMSGLVATPTAVSAETGVGAVAGVSAQDPVGYCTPSNEVFDPLDTRRDAPPPSLPPGFSRRQVQLAGFSTSLIEAGPRNSAEAIVFVHGNPGLSLDWQGVFRAVPDGARVVAFDRLGLGQADKPWDYDYTLDNLADWFGRALDQLGVRRAHLVMHDYGGGLALEWASRQPRRLASATILNSGVPIGYTHHPVARIWREPVLGELAMLAITRESFVAAVQSTNPRPLPREFLDRNYDHFDRPTRCALLDLYREIDDPSAIGVRHAAALRPYDRPALVIWGVEDPFLDASMAERQRDAFPRAAIHMFEDSGHWPFVDNEQRTVDLMRPFFERHVGKRVSAPVPIVAHPAPAPAVAHANTRAAGTGTPAVGRSSGTPGPQDPDHRGGQEPAPALVLATAAAQRSAGSAHMPSTGDETGWAVLHGSWAAIAGLALLAATRPGRGPRELPRR